MIKRGFTLVELLVVISIIGVLSSVVFASLGSAKDKAKATAFRQHVDEFLKAVELARDSNGEAPYGYIRRYSVGSYEADDGYYSVNWKTSYFDPKFRDPGYISDFPQLWRPSSSYGFSYYRPFTSTGYYCGDKTTTGVGDTRQVFFIYAPNSAQRSLLSEVFSDWDIYSSYYFCKVLDE